MKRAETLEKIASLAGEGYKYGFFTDIESEQAPPGLNEDTVRPPSQAVGGDHARIALSLACRQGSEPLGFAPGSRGETEHSSV
jgi:hypothetical protein